MSGPSGLKLESQRIVDFSGKIKDWQKWKNCTQCAFDRSGRNSYHLVKQHIEDKDGYAAWNSLIEWFDDDVLKTETADAFRARLENYKL
eukprot:7679916-Ditylum_brightwellii.AAC.1